MHLLILLHSNLICSRAKAPCKIVHTHWRDTAALKEVKSGSGSTNFHLVLGKPLSFLKITMIFFKNSAVAAAPAANVHMTLMSIL